MGKSRILYLFAVLCLLPTTVWADPANEPVVPSPIDTTPVWLRQMDSPPPYVNTDANAANPIQATTNKEFVPVTTPSYVEAGMNYYAVSNNLGDTFGQFVNVQYQADPWNRWSTGISHADAFNDSGETFSLGNNHRYNEDWYSDVGFSVGSTASFLTRYRVDASLSRIWLDTHNLVTTVGLTWDEADQTYTDKTLHLIVAYYFPSPWIIQAGVNVNDSDPGSVIAPSAFVALTYGYQERYFLTGKVLFAREAYEILNSGDIQTSFNSETYDLTWRQWVDDGWGFNLGAEYYDNPFYNHVGGTVSVFKEF